PATAVAAAGKPPLLLWWLRWRLVLVVARGWSSFGGVVVPAVKRQQGCGDGGGWCSGDDGVAVHGRDMVGKWEASAGWRRFPPWWCRQWWLVGEGGRSGYEEQFLRFAGKLAGKLAGKISGSGGGGRLVGEGREIWVVCVYYL
nr:hypothetical protein [Tanacetum cinerariifolium]